MATETVLEALEAARKLLTPEESWIKGLLAADANGGGVCDPWLPEACKWCSTGAILAITRGWDDAYGGAIEALTREMRMGVAIFNDTHTHADVLRAFDAAIAKEKEAQHVL